MSIPISQIIEINPGVVGAGSNPLALNGLILTPSELAPIGEILTCYSLDDVSTYFGNTSDEYLAAVPYFSANTVRNRKQPDSLLFVRYAPETASAWARGASLKGMTLSEIQQVTGSLEVTIDGTKYSVETLDISSQNSFTAIASAIQTQLALASGQSCVWNSQFSRFEIFSGTSGEGSSISAVTGTAAAGLGLSNAQLSQGSNIIEAQDSVEMASKNHLNWAQFTLLFKDNEIDQSVLKSLAKWQATKNARYFFVAYDDDQNALTPGNESCFGAWCLQNSYNVLACWNNIQVASFVMGCFASVNWDAYNGRITAAFKSQEGLDATVSNYTQAQTLLANGYSYYGAYAADGPKNNYNFFYDSQIGGSYGYADPFVNQIFLNAQLRVAMIDILLGVNTMPYNEQGYALIRSAFMDPINQALNNGSIRAGINLSENQKAQILSMIGFDISQELYNNGYYLYIGDATAQTRSQRQSPPIYFFYCDGGSIQHILIPSIAVL